MPHRLFLYQLLEGNDTELALIKNTYGVQTCQKEKLLGFSSKVLLELILKYRDNYPFKPITVCQERFHLLMEKADSLNITINEITFYNEQDNEDYHEKNLELLFTLKQKDYLRALAIVKELAVYGKVIATINFSIPEGFTITFTRHGEIYVDECFMDEALLTLPSVMLLSENK